MVDKCYVSGLTMEEIPTASAPKSSYKLIEINEWEGEEYYSNYKQPDSPDLQSPCKDAAHNLNVPSLSNF